MLIFVHSAKGKEMCDAHDTDESLEQEERERILDAMDGFADCEAHARSQEEADELCRIYGHVYDNGKCVRCGR